MLSAGTDVRGAQVCRKRTQKGKCRYHFGGTLMKAIVCTKYGSPDVLQLQEVAKPAPKDDEVLIKIHAASINSRDWRMMRAKPFFIRLAPGGVLQPKNKIRGADVA